MVIPSWVSAPWWHLVAPDANHFDTPVVDWLWLPRWDTLFPPGDLVQGQVTPSSPRWRVLVIRLCRTVIGQQSSYTGPFWQPNICLSLLGLGSSEHVLCASPQEMPAKIIIPAREIQPKKSNSSLPVPVPGSGYPEFDFASCELSTLTLTSYLRKPFPLNYNSGMSKNGYRFMFWVQYGYPYSQPV